MSVVGDETRALFDRVRQQSLLPLKKIESAVGGGFQYAKIYGVTSVMALSSLSLATFARELYAELASDQRLAQVMLLLPPDSYHITLRGLEGPLRKGSASVEDFARIDDATRQLFEFAAAHPDQARFAFHDDILSFGSAAVLGVEPATVEFLNALKASQALVDQLGETTQNQYHLSIGYFLKRRDVAAAEVAWAEKRVFDAAQRILKLSQSGSMSVTVDAPKICFYESMEKFVPLFQK